MINKKAFTLIELVVVIAVIAILIGIALPRMKGMQDEARIQKAKTELKTLQTAIESFYIHQNPNAYPDSSEEIVGDVLISASPQIITSELYDPFSDGSSEYIYYRSDNELYYVIHSLGVDGEEDIEGILDDGTLDGDDDDDIYVTNGTGF